MAVKAMTRTFARYAKEELQNFAWNFEQKINFPKDFY